MCVNDDLLELEDLDSLSTATIEVPDYDPVTIHQVFPQRRNRTTHLKGISYWVHAEVCSMTHVVREKSTDLPVQSQNTVGEFIDRVLESCPSISEGDIAKITEILAKLGECAIRL